MHRLRYDEACCFCAGFARRAQVWGKGRLEIVPFTPAELAQATSFHLEGPAGTVLKGPDALPELFRLTLPLGGAAAWLVTHVPGSPTVLRFLYKWISEHRW